MRATRSSESTRVRRAVSLIDLVITVLVTAILSAAAAPKFSGALSRYRAEAAASQIVADINYARQFARQTSDSVSVSFTVDPPGYTLSGVPSLDKSGADFAVDLAELGYEVSFGSVDFDDEEDFSFNQYGRPMSIDGASAIETGSIAVQSGSDLRTVIINTDTGKAEVQ